MMRLKLVDKVNPSLKEMMTHHYSHPKGFVGRSLCYAIYYDNHLYGFIVAGSSPKWLPGRDEYFGIKKIQIQSIIDNIFFHIERKDGRYPIRNFVPKVIALWRRRAARQWKARYGNKVIGFESLVEPPRTGECYIRDGWVQVGITKGFTCKRTAGPGTDSYYGRREWDRENLRPKLVFCRRND